MIYEKPRLIDFEMMAGHGQDCLPGGTAPSTCSSGTATSGGDCLAVGTTAGVHCYDGSDASDECKTGDTAVTKCAPGGAVG